MTSTLVISSAVQILCTLFAIMVIVIPLMASLKKAFEQEVISITIPRKIPELQEWPRRFQDHIILLKKVYSIIIRKSVFLIVCIILVGIVFPVYLSNRPEELRFVSLELLYLISLVMMLLFVGDWISSVIIALNMLGGDDYITFYKEEKKMRKKVASLMKRLRKNQIDEE